MKQLDGTGLKRLHRSFRQRFDQHCALILDNVASPFNVGSIARTAAAYRVDHVWAAGDTPSFRDNKVQKTALGCDRYFTAESVATPLDAIAAARAAGYRIVAIELAEGALPIHQADLDGRVALLVGHEDRGVTPATLAACDAVAFIPQLGKIGSLNVATATAIALWELTRRHL